MSIHNEGDVHVNPNMASACPPHTHAHHPYPQAVTGLADGLARIEWSEPVSNGGEEIKSIRILATPIEYEVIEPMTVPPQLVVPICAEGSDGKHDLTGLAQGVRYSIVLSAMNRHGWSPESAPVITPMVTVANWHSLRTAQPACPPQWTL